MKKNFKEGDIFHDGVLGYWIFFKHKGNLRLYPYDKYNKGKLSEGKPSLYKCNSFIHDPATCDLSKIKIVGNIYKTSTS